MAKRWSKLKSLVEDLFVEDLPLRIQCSEIRRSRQNDGALTTELGIFSVRLDKVVIWDFPKQFVTYWTQYPDGGNHYSFSVSDINDLLREYLDTPKAELPAKNFPQDHFGITDILKAADRRISLARLEQHFVSSERSFVMAVLEDRRALTKRSTRTARKRAAG